MIKDTTTGEFFWFFLLFVNYISFWIFINRIANNPDIEKDLYSWERSNIFRDRFNRKPLSREEIAKIWTLGIENVTSIMVRVKEFYTFYFAIVKFYYLLVYERVAWITSGKRLFPNWHERRKNRNIPIEELEEEKKELLKNPNGKFSFENYFDLETRQRKLIFFGFMEDVYGFFNNCKKIIFEKAQLQFFFSKMYSTTICTYLFKFFEETRIYVYENVWVNFSIEFPKIPNNLFWDPLVIFRIFCYFTILILHIYAYWVVDHFLFFKEADVMEEDLKSKYGKISALTSFVANNVNWEEFLTFFDHGVVDNDERWIDGITRFQERWEEKLPLVKGKTTLLYFAHPLEISSIKSESWSVDPHTLSDKRVFDFQGASKCSDIYPPSTCRSMTKTLITLSSKISDENPPTQTDWYNLFYQTKIHIPSRKWIEFMVNALNTNQEIKTSLIFSVQQIFLSLITCNLDSHQTIPQLIKKFSLNLTETVFHSSGSSPKNFTLDSFAFQPKRRFPVPRKPGSTDKEYKEDESLWDEYCDDAENKVRWCTEGFSYFSFKFYVDNFSSLSGHAINSQGQKDLSNTTKWKETWAKFSDHRFTFTPGNLFTGKLIINIINYFYWNRGFDPIEKWYNEKKAHLSEASDVRTPYFQLHCGLRSYFSDGLIPNATVYYKVAGDLTSKTSYDGIRTIKRIINFTSVQRDTPCDFLGYNSKDCIQEGLQLEHLSGKIVDATDIVQDTFSTDSERFVRFKIKELLGNNHFFESINYEILTETIENILQHRKIFKNLRRCPVYMEPTRCEEILVLLKYGIAFAVSGIGFNIYKMIRWYEFEDPEMRGKLILKLEMFWSGVCAFFYQCILAHTAKEYRNLVNSKGDSPFRACIPDFVGEASFRLSLVIFTTLLKREFRYPCIIGWLAALFGLTNAQFEAKTFEPEPWELRGIWEPFLYDLLFAVSSHFHCIQSRDSVLWYIWLWYMTIFRNPQVWEDVSHYILHPLLRNASFLSSKLIMLELTLAVFFNCLKYLVGLYRSLTKS